MRRSAAPASAWAASAWAASAWTTSNSSVTWTSNSLLTRTSAPRGFPGACAARWRPGHRARAGSRPSRPGRTARSRRRCPWRACCGSRGDHRDGDRHLLGAQVEGAFQVGARDRLGEQHRARLVHRDTQVLDLVQGEVKPRRQARGGRPEHGKVGALGGHAHLHVIVGLAIRTPRARLPLARHGPAFRRRGGVFGHVSPSGGSSGRRPPASNLPPPARAEKCAAPPRSAARPVRTRNETRVSPPQSRVKPGFHHATQPSLRPAWSPRRSC